MAKKQKTKKRFSSTTNQWKSKNTLKTKVKKTKKKVR